MTIEEEYQYETTIDQIVYHLEQLIADVLLASIKRMSGEYRETVLNVTGEKQEDF
jgi:hypothetical protein